MHERSPEIRVEYVVKMLTSRKQQKCSLAELNFMQANAIFAHILMICGLKSVLFSLFEDLYVNK